MTREAARDLDLDLGRRYSGVVRLSLLGTYYIEAKVVASLFEPCKYGRELLVM